MKSNHSISLWFVCVLGAIDGLLVGFALEHSRLIYERHQIEARLQQAAENRGRIGFLMGPTFDLFIPLICVITFVAVGHLGYRYLRRLPQSVLLLWILGVAIAVLVGFFVAGPGDLSGLLYVALFSFISYLVYWFWKRHLDSVLMLWQVIGVSGILTLAAGTQITGLFRVQRWEVRRPFLWLFCLLVVLLVNLVYGTVLHLIFSLYDRNKPQAYNSAAEP